MTMESTHWIVESKLPELRAEIERLNARADKLGCTRISLTVGASRDDAIGEGRFVRRIEVTVSGKAPRVNGWELVAKLERADDTNIIFTVPSHTLPERFFNAPPDCEHCGLSRQRVLTYVLRHENGDYKQVGSTCLADFLGNSDPHVIAAWAEIIESAIDATADCENEIDGGAHLSHYIDLESYLISVARSIREHGWMSNAKAQELCKVATYLDALDTMREHSDDCDIATTRAAVEYAKSLNTQSEFDHNLRTIAESNSVKFRHLPFAACIVNSYLRHESERKAAGSTAHVGEIGKKLTAIATLIECRNLGTTQWGQSYLLKFHNERQNLIVWFTSKSLELGTYTVSATVKEHSEFRGVKQTVITRAKTVPYHT